MSLVIASLLLSLAARAQDPAPAPVAPSTEPWLRAGLSFAMVPHSYRMTSDAPDVPPEVTYSSALVTGGFELHGLAWVPSAMNWGGELSWKGFFDLVEVDGETYNGFGNSFLLGGRYRTDPEPGLGWYGALGLHRISAPLFRYASLADVGGRAQLIRKGVYGARLGVGALYTKDKLFVDVGVGQTLSPQPVDFNVGASGEYQLGKALAFRGALDVDTRTILFDIGESGEAKVRDTEVSITLGVNYLLF